MEAVDAHWTEDADIGPVENPQLGPILIAIPHGDGTSVEVHSRDASGQTVGIATLNDGARAAMLMLYTPELACGRRIGLHWGMTAEEARGMAVVLTKIADKLDNREGLN